MTDHDLQQVADRSSSAARERGHVSPQEMREELQRAGLSDDLDKDVLALARSALNYRSGRYEYAAVSGASVPTSRSAAA